MKFEDLEFGPHPSGLSGSQARVDFANGYGASVITGDFAYSTPDKPYELAVFKGDALCYDTPITDDVIGHCDEADITRLLAEIEALPEDKDHEQAT